MMILKNVGSCEDEPTLFTNSDDDSPTSQVPLMRFVVFLMEEVSYCSDCC